MKRIVASRERGPGRRIAGAVLALASLGVPSFAADLAAKAQSATAGTPGPRPIQILEKAWPGHPEWVAMFVDILGGSRLGPTDGWFRKGVAQTRFDWKTASSWFDKDGDGRIVADEFPGSAADFARLDRDHDGVLAERDFDFSANALAPLPGSSTFYGADRDGNGKVTREEWEAMFREECDRTFREADRGGLGFLSLGDVQEANAPAPKPSQTTVQPKPTGPQGPSKATLLRGLFRQEIGSLQAGPALNQVAPEFTLKTVDGQDEVTLSKLVGAKPVVLIFGNFTCGPFRSQAGNVEKLSRRYKDRARFVMVYVREAHPNDGWHMESNNRVGVSLRQPQSYAERQGVAQRCSKTLDLGFPMLVDELDDPVGALYSGMPSRLYLIDGQGKVAYKSGRGPFGFKPAEVEHSLLLLLNPPASAEVARP